MNTTKKPKASKSFPRGEGGPAKPGRMRNAGGNLKVSTTDQTYSQVVVRTQVEVFRCPNSIGYRPHSSSVRKTVL